MKRIYTSRNLTHCDMVRGVLVESGIRAMLKNELVCSTAGGSIVGSLGFAWPEVWVNDEDAKAAEECLKDSGLSFLTSEPD
jgi:hypothetical protein